VDQSMQGAVRRGDVLSLVQRSVRRRDYGLRWGDQDLGRLRFAPGRRALAQAETDQTGSLVLTAVRGGVEVRHRDSGATVATVLPGRGRTMLIRTAQGFLKAWTAWAAGTTTWVGRLPPPSRRGPAHRRPAATGRGPEPGYSPQIAPASSPVTVAPGVPPLREPDSSPAAPWPIWNR
jgi:hypothetical protein